MKLATSRGTDCHVFYVSDNLYDFCVQRNDNCLRVQLMLCSLDAPVVYAQRVLAYSPNLLQCSVHALATFLPPIFRHWFTFCL